jgi:PAS domain S-box-containing protein
VNNPNRSADSQLRRQAEKRLHDMSPPKAESPLNEVSRVMHELRVHQIQLQMQNEELREARAELELQRDLFADLYDFSPSGFVSLNVEGKICQTNLSGAQLLGKRRLCLSGSRFDLFVHASDRAEFTACVGRAFMDTGRQHCEVRLSVGGHPSITITVAIEVAQSPDGHECRLVLNDITSARATQDALQSSEERLRLAMEASTVGLWDWDVDSNLCYFSATYFQMLGYAPDGFASTRDVWVSMIHPDDRPDVIATYQQCIDNRQPDFRLEYRMKAKDGSWKWLLGRGKAGRRDSHGMAQRMIGTVVDITADRKCETELLAAKAQAEQANNAKSRFLAAASHDLRQPLAALGMYVEVLKAKARASDDILLTNMSNCVSSLSELLTDLLDISKLEAGVVVPEVTNFSVAQMLEKLVAVHLPQAVVKGLRLRCVPTKLHARTDSVLLRRIVSNLIANAIRYTVRGGVLLGCRRHQGKYWIEVRDTGIGIPAEKIDEIFEEYKQLEPDERSRGQVNSSGGSGLGLAIVAKSAALLGLQVRVQSWVGKGSLFAIELPLGVGSAVVERRETRRRSLRISLVDDNTAMLDALGSALTAIGHQVVVSATCDEMLAALEGSAPDMVITDYRLAHGATGYEVITAARGKFGQNLPALIITGDSDPQLMRSMAAQGIAVEHKPLDFKSLQLCIAKAVKPG